MIAMLPFRCSSDHQHESFPHVRVHGPPSLQYPGHAPLFHALSVQLPRVTTPSSKHNPLSKQNAFDAQHAEAVPVAEQDVCFDKDPSGK